VTTATLRFLVVFVGHFRANPTFQLCTPASFQIPQLQFTDHDSVQLQILTVFKRPTFQQTPSCTAFKIRQIFYLKFLNSWRFVQLKN